MSKTKTYIARYNGQLVGQISSSQPKPYAIITQASEEVAREVYLREESERAVMAAFRYFTELAAQTADEPGPYADAIETAKQRVAAGPEALRAVRRENFRQTFESSKASGHYLIKVSAWAKDLADAEKRAASKRRDSLLALVEIVPTEIAGSISSPEAALQSQLEEIAKQTKDRVQVAAFRYAEAQGIRTTKAFKDALASLIKLLK